jgi:phosphatidate cytidylyltransferase
MKNFIIRLFTAIAIVAVQVLCTYLSPYSFAGLFLLLTALAVNEFLKILSHGGQVQFSRPLMIVGSCYLFFAFWLNSLSELSMLVLFVPYLLFLLFCYIRELFSNNSNPVFNLGAMVLSQAYVVLPLSLVNTK